MDIPSEITNPSMNAWVTESPGPSNGRSSSEGNGKTETPRFTVTLLIPTDAIGLLIGKGGTNLKEITQHSKARLALQDFNDVPRRARDRGVLLSGTFEAITTAEKIILDKLRGRRPQTDADEIALGDDKYMLKWVIPNDRCGLLIGRGGSGIKEINEHSGAWVKVAHEQEMMPGSLERTVYITGTREQNEAARQMIVAQVGGRPFSATVGLDPGSVVIYIPSRAIGHILGIGGAGIKGIVNETHARVRIANLSEMDMGSTEIRTIITGPSAEAVEAAKQQVQQRVEEWRREKGAHLGLGDHLEHETSIKMTVPVPLIGQVIGKSGSFVQNALQKNGVVIKILQDTASPSLTVDERPLMITGLLEEVLRVQLQLLERIEHAAANYPGMLYRMPTQPPPGHPPDPRLFPTYEPYAIPPTTLRDSFTLGEAAAAAAGLPSTPDSFVEAYSSSSEYYSVNRPEMGYVQLPEPEFEQAGTTPTISANASPLVAPVPQPERVLTSTGMSPLDLSYVYTYGVPLTPVLPTMLTPAAAALYDQTGHRVAAPFDQTTARVTPIVAANHFASVQHIEEAMTSLSLNQGSHKFQTPGRQFRQPQQGGSL